MLSKIVFLLFISVELFSITLKDTYYVNSNHIKLLDIVPNASYDVTLYKIDDGRYTKRIKTKYVINMLKSHDISNIESSSRYIKFIKKSPIDIKPIKLKIKQKYIQMYPDIKINSISILPRGYVKSLSDSYEVHLSKKSYLSNKGTLSIKTTNHKKIFFDYLIDADLTIFLSKSILKKGEKLSFLNTLKKDIKFIKFRALPINKNQINTRQIKRKIKENSIITFKNTELLNVINKGDNVNVFFRDGNINISFYAKALKNGKLNDIITVQKSDGRKIRARVVGKNRLEMR